MKGSCLVLNGGKMYIKQSGYHTPSLPTGKRACVSLRSTALKVLSELLEHDDHEVVRYNITLSIGHVLMKNG